jgi:hypothetical protein
MRAMYTNFHLEIGGPPIESIEFVNERVGVSYPLNTVWIDLPNIVHCLDGVDGQRCTVGHYPFQ